jgi:hypothetical protein
MNVEPPRDMEDVPAGATTPAKSPLFKDCPSSLAPLEGFLDGIVIAQLAHRQVSPSWRAAIGHAFPRCLRALSLREGAARQSTRKARKEE